MVSSKAVADDLDDGIEYDEVYISDGEAAEELLESRLDYDSDSDEEVQTSGQDITGGVKRKKKPKGDNGNSKEKLALKKKLKVEHFVKQKQNLWKNDVQLVCDFIATRARVKNPNLSGLELNEQFFLSPRDFKYTGDYLGERNLDGYKEFIREFFLPYMQYLKPQTKVKKEKKPKNSKTSTNSLGNSKCIVILATSAIRVCDINRKFLNSIKLIAKNSFKNDSLLFQNQTYPPFIIATPGRFLRHLQNGDISGKYIDGIILDSSYLDSKQQNIWDSQDFMGTLKKIVSGINSIDEDAEMIGNDAETRIKVLLY